MEKSAPTSGDFFERLSFFRFENGCYDSLTAENTGSVYVAHGFSFKTAEIVSSSGRISFSGEVENRLSAKTVSRSIKNEITK